MQFTAILQKLTELELSIGIESENEVRYRVLDIQECLLRLQADLTSRLRNHGESSESQRFSLLRSFSPPKNPTDFS